MKVISRGEAKALGLRRYFTGKPCKRGHVAERYVANGACVVCERECTAAWKAKNTEKARATKAVWRVKNTERERANNAAWYAAHRDECRADRAAWSKANRSKHNAYTAKRKARKLKATPTWADQDAIDAFYVEAARRRLTVDHIIPLQSPIVCGLHVPENLQLLTKSQNSAKGNRF